jgi:hypothetical protein
MAFDFVYTEKNCASFPASCNSLNYQLRKRRILDQVHVVYFGDKKKPIFKKPPSSTPGHYP